MKYYAGIDPGFTGALAVIDESTRVMGLADTPVRKVPFVKNGKRRTRTELDIETMRDLLSAYDFEHVLLENVTARTGQGVVSMFRFGHGLGVWEGLLAGLKIPYSKILPTVWKKGFDLVGEEKDASRLLAQKLFPDADLRLKKHHGRGDALCLAQFCKSYRGKR